MFAVWLSKLLPTSIYHTPAYGSQEAWCSGSVQTSHHLPHHPQLPPPSPPRREWQASSSAWLEPLSPNPQGQRRGHIVINSSLSCSHGRLLHRCTYAHARSLSAHTHTQPAATHSPVTTSTWPLLNVLGCHTRTHSHKQPAGLQVAAASRLLLSLRVCVWNHLGGGC